MHPGVLVTETALGTFIRSRCEELNLSNNELAKRSGLSHTYIRHLVEGVNPSTGRPISPTQAALDKLAKGLAVDVAILQRIASGKAPHGPGTGVPVEEFQDIVEVLRGMTPEQRESLLSYARFIKSQGKG